MRGIDLLSVGTPCYTDILSAKDVLPLSVVSFWRVARSVETIERVGKQVHDVRVTGIAGKALGIDIGVGKTRVDRAIETFS